MPARGRPRSTHGGCTSPDQVRGRPFRARLRRVPQEEDPGVSNQHSGWGVIDRIAPLILTLAIDGASFAYLDGLRRRLFPADRNVVPAHLTLFHALPGEHRVLIGRELDAVCSRQRPLELEATGFRSLGRGVALALAAPRLVAIRDELAREWRDWLTPQDSARIAPHVTVQNKVTPDLARKTLRDLQAGFVPFTIQGEGLALWSYLGGPWRLERRIRFAG